MRDQAIEVGKQNDAELGEGGGFLSMGGHSRLVVREVVARAVV